MITYVYWAFVIILMLGALYLLGLRLHQWNAAFITSSVILIICAAFYYFYLEQVFVKRWGGSMTINLDPKLRHIAATWKGDNLWIQNYDPASNTCIFQEYSRGNVLEGRVVIKNCNPIALPTRPTLSPNSTGEQTQ